MSNLSFRANGKLLLFGEYFVLDGCPALAWPTKFGQSLEVRTDSVQVKGLYWKSLNHKGEIWFEVYLDEELNVLHGLSDEVSERLQKFLLHARALNPDFLRNDYYHEATIRADYPSEWGLGSSSTLISLIAQWAQVDAMELFFRSFTGSGYDIACATAQKPLLYQLTAPQKAHWKELQLADSFLHEAVFVYLGKKQDSREGIAHYQATGRSDTVAKEKMTLLIESLLQQPSREQLLLAMKESEAIISTSLSLPVVKEQFFADFPGEVKSLGAWGGDFVMALAKEPSFDAKEYFSKRGYATCFSAKEILL